MIASGEHDALDSRTPEALRATLEARAKALARPPAKDDDAAGDAVDLLQFQVGDEMLAIPLSGIVAIARPSGIAPLPRAVRPVYGVTAWRGRPLTVLSLAPGRPSITPDTRLIVLGTSARAALAIVVDAIHDVARTAQSKLTPAGPGPREPYALGMTQDGLLVVSADALLRPETLHT